MSTGVSTRVDVTRTHLELRALTALRPAREPAVKATLYCRRPIGACEYRALYTMVGARWFWRDRLVWTDDELHAYLASPNVHIWTMSVGGQTAGYFELQHHSSGTIEIMYFGLVGQFIGRGLGGWLLTRAVQESFALGATRVVLNTCTLDSPQALPNYLARGFTIVREEQYTLELSDRSAAVTSARAPQAAEQR
jgi:GNAT superfamily N-acetyltransferase